MHSVSLLQNIQVCVEPRTSALNMTLPAAATRAPVYIGRYLLPAPRLRQEDRRDRQADGLTDGRTPDRYIDLAPHNRRAT